ncbi:MAG: thioredoxin family protein [Verrucomicrobiae bacterium]|nr:thioredoxin family protein [Verrucomicrobiae bacterium]
MKQKLALAALMVCAFGAQAALKIGDKIPATDVKLTGEGGKEYTLAELKGPRGLLVIFTCNACPYAVAWERRIVDLGNKWIQKEYGVGVVAVNPNDPNVSPSDTLDKIVARAKKEFYKFPYLADTTQNLAKAFGATKTPECFLFNAKGELVYHGAVDDNHKDAKKVKQKYLEQALNAMRHGEPIPVPETKAIGCTIKWRK